MRETYRREAAYVHNSKDVTRGTSQRQEAVRLIGVITCRQGDWSVWQVTITPERQTLSAFSRAGDSARATKRVHARCSTARTGADEGNRFVHRQRPHLNVNTLRGLRQPKEKETAPPRAPAGVGGGVKPVARKLPKSDVAVCDQLAIVLHTSPPEPCMTRSRQRRSCAVV